MAEESSEKMTGEATEDEPFKAVPVKRKRKKIFTPIVEQLKLQIRFNLSARKVEIRVRLLLFITYLTNVLLLEVLSLISDEYFFAL